MKITNKYGLPEVIVRAIENDPYNNGGADISVTSLIGPPQIRRLMQEHGDKVEVDVSDRLYSLMGQAMHRILEMADTTAMVEERFFSDIVCAHGQKSLSGQIDRYENGVIQDWKFTSVWEYIFGLKPEREAQLNVLAAPYACERPRRYGAAKQHAVPRLVSHQGEARQRLPKTANCRYPGSCVG